MRIERRIFIVGVPRSGTTLVQSLIAAHSAMTSFTESHFFSRYFSWLPGMSMPVLTRNPAPRVVEFLDENREESAGAADWFSTFRPLRVRPLLPFLTGRVARRLLGVLDALALARGRSIWVEKTPRHLRYAPFLERMAGGVPTDFVHVIRDGLETVASLRKASQSWERPYDLETCVRRWNADVAFSLSRIRRPNDHFVVYEELTSRPETVLGQLLERLGLAWEPAILERYGQACETLVTGQEAWKKGVGRSIRRSETAGQALSSAQRQRAQDALCHDLLDQIRSARESDR